VKISIDAERCTGHGRCYTIAPLLFTDDDRGFGEVLGDGEVTSENEVMAGAAVAGCPEHAVLVNGS
jgi:ferredoxin